MTKHVLFVCKSCNSVHSEDINYENSEGAVLLQQLLHLHQDWSHQDEFEIRPVGCLWTCSNSCAVAFSGTNKATYLFTKVPFAQAGALLQFGERYLHSKAGDVPWKQFPEVLQSAEVAKIPPMHGVEK